MEPCYYFALSLGFLLAGIYPVGMKIAADWFATGLGKALGWLVGALVLGTGFPAPAKGDRLAFYLAAGHSVYFRLCFDGRPAGYSPSYLMALSKSRQTVFVRP